MTPDGHTTGLFPEVLGRIAKEQNWKIEYVHGTWMECLKRLQDGEIDLMPDVAVSEERKKIYDFSKEPVLVNWGTVFSRPDLRINSFLDMQNRTIAVMKGSIHTEGKFGIKALMSQFGVPCHIIEVDNYQEVLMLVESKQADAGVVNRLFGTLNADKYDIVPTPIIFNPRVLTFATKKGDQQNIKRLAIIDESLRKSKNNPDSLYHQVLAYYLGGGTRKWEGQNKRYLRKIILDPAELQWIKKHPVVRFSVDPGFAPFELLTPNGAYSGMAADFLNIIEQKTGIRFEMITHGSWSETIQAIQSHKIDMLPCIGFSMEREGFLAYSEPYLKFARVVVTRMDSPISSLEDLKTSQIGVQTNSSNHAFIKEKTTIEPILYNTFEESLLAVSRGEIDATIGNLATTTYLIQNLALTNIKSAFYADPKPQALAYGIRKDWPELVSIINHALKSISVQQRGEIFAKWLPLPQAAQSDIDLTQKEREWLLMHPRIRIGWDTSWAPIEFADAQGLPQGVSIEYLNAIGKMLGIQFDFGKPTDWQSTYKKLQNRELDMSSCLAITPQRLKHLNFTDSYLDAPVVFFAREGMHYIRDISELSSMRVAVVENYATDEWVSRDHPELQLIRVPSIAAGFDMLKRRKIDIFIASVHPGNYYLSKNHFRNISIVGETPYAYKLRMAVRNDWPLFAGILQKALNALPETDKTSFYRKWVWLGYEHRFDYSLIWKIVAGACAIIILFVYWNRRLRLEILARKNAQVALIEREKALRESYADVMKLEELKDNLTHMIVHDIRSPLTTIMGALDLLEENSPESDRYTLHLAQIEVQRVTDMAQSLLDIARLEKGMMPLEVINTEIKSIAEKAIGAMVLQADIAGVRLVLSGPAVNAEADPDILHRMLRNLIGNAIKASQQGSSVEIRTIDNGPEVIIEVQDSGHGIPREFHDSLFVKFKTATTNPQYKTSVGLGLAFCKLAIEAHGGSIQIQSQEGRGSIFRIQFPKKKSLSLKPLNNETESAAQDGSWIKPQTTPGTKTTKKTQHHKHEIA